MDENGKTYALLHTGTRIDEVRAALNDAKQKVDYLDSVLTPVMVVGKDFNVRFMNPAKEWVRHLRLVWGRSVSVSLTLVTATRLIVRLQRQCKRTTSAPMVP